MKRIAMAWVLAVMQAHAGTPAATVAYPVTFAGKTSDDGSGTDGEVFEISGY